MIIDYEFQIITHDFTLTSTDTFVAGKTLTYSISFFLWDQCIHTSMCTYTLGLYSMECMHIPRESRARQNFFFHQPWNVEIKLIYFLLNINNGITFVPGQKDHEHAIIYRSLKLTSELILLLFLYCTLHSWFFIPFFFTIFYLHFFEDEIFEIFIIPLFLILVWYLFLV